MTQSHQPAIALAEKLNRLLEEDYMIFFTPIVVLTPMRLPSKWHVNTMLKTVKAHALKLFHAIVHIMGVHLVHWPRQAGTAKVQV